MSNAGDGDPPIENLKVSLSVNPFHEEEKGYSRTVAGMTSHVLQRIPNTGDHYIQDTSMK